ncbi:penicillin-binding protein 2, partial [Pseudomonas sp. CCI2.4]|nr:penicillin-binding protein 2 [Pseudomonas sp. CCI2.4]
VRGRVVVGAAVVMVAVCVLIARLYFLQVIQYDYHSTQSENNRVHVQPIPPNRGQIFDRNAVVVAENRPSFSLSITRERSRN